jgi:hypothetical protein
MKTLKDILDSGMGTVAGWLEANYDDFYLVPKSFMSDFQKELLIESVEAIEEGAPRGEIYDDLDSVEEVMDAVYTFIKEGE